MDAILSSPTISPSKYEVLNYCRMHLQVTTLSDIATSDGKYIRHDALLGCTDWSKFLDVMQWPNQPRPDPDSWKLWDKTIRTLFCNEDGQKLRQPLGKWTETETKKWKFRYSHSHQALYRYSKSKWHRHQNLKRSRRRILSEDASQPTPLPTDSVP
eukprot:scaffold109546_cov35-Attheya_sp.AAC.1